MKEALKTSKNKENSLADDLNDLNNELQKKQKAYNKILREKDGIDQENDELRRQIKRLSSGLQVILYLICNVYVTILTYPTICVKNYLQEFY